MGSSIDFSTLPLRDIHFPGPVSWWPPAPGWWLLFGVLVAAIALAAYQRYRTRRVCAALQAIRQITADLDAGEEPVVCLQRLSVVLRRFAMSTASGDAARGVPGMVGDRWLEYLDARGGGGAFRDGPGKLLLDAPYAPQGALDRDDALELGRLLAGWVRVQRPGG
jgi:hypothetical protein